MSPMSRLGCHMNEDARVRLGDEVAHSVQIEKVELKNDGSIDNWITAVEQMQTMQKTLGLTHDLQRDPIAFLGNIL